MPHIKPKRILYVQPYNWECGPHFSLHALITHIDFDRYHPVVLLPSESNVSEEFKRLGAVVHFDPGILTVPRDLAPARQARFWAQTFRSALRIASIISKTYRIDLVHVNSEACWVGAFAAKIASAPVITHLRGLSVLSPRWVGMTTSKILNGFNRALIATSGHVKRSYVAAGVRPDIVHLVYNGLDVDIFNPRKTAPALRSELGISADEKLIGMIANLDRRKGHHDFIKTCALVRRQIPSTRFVIIGDTILGGRDYLEEVRRLINTLGLGGAIQLLGSRRDIPSILASLDVVVQPSLTEAGPRVPLEAMAMERPIVVTDVGGNSEEVVDGKTGIVVPAGDWQAAAKAVIQLLNNHELAGILGKAGRQRVWAKFSDQIYARRIQEIYQSIFEKCPASIRLS